MRHSLSQAVVVCVFVSACHGNETTDASSDASDAMMDVRQDIVPDGPPADSGTPLFRHCTTGASCGTGYRCDTGYPGGLCTRRCTRDSECGTAGRCAFNQCTPRCSLGGRECDSTTVCDWYQTGMTEVRGCFPACQVSPADGGVACNTGTQCDLYAGAGNCDVSGPPTTGGQNGDPCQTNADCLGRCWPEFWSDGTPSSLPGGMCVSDGRAEDLNNYQVDAPYPHGNCPAGSVALPYDPISDDGDAAACVKECRTIDDCRPGFACFYYHAFGRQTSTGYCDGINCMHPIFAGLPNHHCPTGYTCEPYVDSAGMTWGVCTASPSADAGTDAGADAAEDAAPDGAGDASAD